MKSRGFFQTPQDIMEEYNGCSIPQYTRYGLKVGGGRTRIRTRVFGLEGQSDIQTTLYVLNQCDGLLLKKFTIV